MAGWKIPYNRGFDRKMTDKWSIFQQAMFDYRRVIGDLSITHRELTWNMAMAQFQWAESELGRCRVELLHKMHNIVYAKSPSY